MNKPADDTKKKLDDIMTRFLGHVAAQQDKDSEEVQQQETDEQSEDDSKE